VVREDGFINLGGGISMVEAGGDLELKNRTARDLLAVVVRRPGGDSYYVPRLADGESVRVSSADKLPRLGKTAFYGGAAVRRLDASVFGERADRDARGAQAAWLALEALVGTNADWWPDDVPVLVAQLDGGEGKTSDSGLRLDVDRVLVRVVGWGGVP
jgi:hypothetical protein